MTASVARLERQYRRLLRCYPRSWRQHREEEVVSLLLEQAAAEQRSTVGVRAAIDLIGHGIEARIDTALRWLPWRLREQVAMAALVVAAGLSLIMLVGEIIGAHHRPPAEEISSYGLYFISGPFLTIGVGMYFGYMTAALPLRGGTCGPDPPLGDVDHGLRRLDALADRVRRLPPTAAARSRAFCHAWRPGLAGGNQNDEFVRPTPDRLRSCFRR